MAINIWAVLVAAIAGMVLGALWYSPILFGNLWMQLSGIRPPKNPDRAAMYRGYLLGFLSQVVIASAIAALLAYSGRSGFGAGITVASLVWLGVLMYTFSQVIWEGKSPNLWILNNTYNLLSLLAMGAIIGAWP